MRCFAVFSAAIGLCCAVAMAQQAPTQQTRPATPQQSANQTPGVGAADSGRSSHIDQQLRELIAISNEHEVQLAQFAQQKASSDEVKRFAKKMADEHTRFVQQLRGNQASDQQGAQQSPQARTANQNQAGAPNQQPANRADQADAQRDANNRPSARDNQNFQSNQQAHSGQLDAVQLHRELAQSCLQETKRMLGEKSQAEFDKCYIGSQVGAHLGMLAALQVFERHASGGLAQQIEQAIATTREHLQHAEKLAATLDQQNARRNVSQRDNERDDEKAQARSERRSNANDE